MDIFFGSSQVAWVVIISSSQPKNLKINMTISIATAIRNYDMMVDLKEARRTIGEPDPFRITSQDRLGFILLKRVGLFENRGPAVAAASEERSRLNIKHKKAWDKGLNILPEFSRTQRKMLNERDKFIRRLSLGVLGGLAILVPMLIMALVNTLMMSLVVTCVATLLFAVVLSLPLYGGDLDEQTVLGAVAAYAAILVVFVGTSLAI